VEQLGQRPNYLYVRTPVGTDIAALETALLAQFPDVVTTTTEDLRELHRTLGTTLTRLVTIMGLVSLLVGGIGIANTMIVLIGRRNLEIAVCKTVGMQEDQVMLIFLVEALSLGIWGGLLGVALGLGVVYGLRGVAESFLAQSLQFVVYPEPIGIGLMLGIVVTLAFAALPTLAAGQVRPNQLLRPGEAQLPRAGRRASVGVVVSLTLVMGFVASRILGDWFLGLLGTVLAVAGLGLAVLLLRGFIWVLSHVPIRGRISLMLAQRSVRAHLGRAAGTMLALVIGVFSLSIVLILTYGTLKLLANSLEEWVGGNVLVAVQSLDAGEVLEQRIAQLPGVLSFEHDTIYGAKIVAVNGDRDIAAWTAGALEMAGGSGSAAAQIEELVTVFDMKVLEEDTWAYRVMQGRDIVIDPPRRVADAQHFLLEPSVYDPNGLYGWLNLKPGDAITFQFAGGVERTGVIAGITARHESGFLAVSNFRETRGIVPSGFVPEGVLPEPSYYALQVADDRMNETLTTLSEISGTFMVETNQMSRFAERLLNQLFSLPLIVAGLALFTGGTIIANTVSLATMERRRQIGIMKALGLQTERVLGLLLLENGLVGLASGLIGVVLAIIAVSAFNLLGEGGGNLPLAVIGLVLVLAVALSLAATALTAYGAAREKPLHVLRYE
jgi:ABC-type antimicrobial peptide transport system permease subunit